MATDSRACAPVRSCRICVHYGQPPTDVGGVAVGDCRGRNADWWPHRGYGPCPHYVERPLSDEEGIPAESPRTCLRSRTKGLNDEDD